MASSTCGDATSPRLSWRSGSITRRAVGGNSERLRTGASPRNAAPSSSSWRRRARCIPRRSPTPWARSLTRSDPRCIGWSRRRKSPNETTGNTAHEVDRCRTVAGGRNAFGPRNARDCLEFFSERCSVAPLLGVGMGGGRNGRNAPQRGATHCNGELPMIGLEKLRLCDCHDPQMVVRTDNDPREPLWWVECSGCGWTCDAETTRQAAIETWNAYHGED